MPEIPETLEIPKIPEDRALRCVLQGTLIPLPLPISLLCFNKGDSDGLNDDTHCLFDELFIFNKFVLSVNLDLSLNKPDRPSKYLFLSLCILSASRPRCVLSFSLSLFLPFDTSVNDAAIKAFVCEILPLLVFLFSSLVSIISLLLLFVVAVGVREDIPGGDPIVDPRSLLFFTVLLVAFDDDATAVDVFNGTFKFNS